MAGNRFSDIAGKIRDAIPSVGIPEMGREVEIPVFVIHNSSDPEDYFFLFDFEVFVDRSKTGSFVRPKLKVWAGRDDFNRIVFAREFRQVFAGEFDRMRQTVTENQSKKMGWLNWNFGFDVVTSLVSGIVANVVLLIAAGAGRAIFGELSMPAWLKGKSSETRVEDQVDQLKARVDDVLKSIDLSVHPELAQHAGQSVLGADRDAWPLPDYVKKHLGDAKSGSWW